MKQSVWVDYTKKRDKEAGGKMKYIVLIAILITNFQCIQADEIKPWTWTYAKRILPSDVSQNKKQVTFMHTRVQPFTQLMFSWNALRPERGFLRFWAQAYINNKWHEPHMMIDWGASVQRSYFTPQDITKAHHVRLEVPHHMPSHGFRIIIQAHEGADINHLKALFVCTSNLTQFSSEQPDYIHTLKSIRLDRVPQHSQMVVQHPDFERICSPTSTSMLVGYLKKKSVDPASFAQKSYDQGLDSYGSWPFNMAHAYEHMGGYYYFCAMRLHSFAELHSQLSLGIPVVVSVRGELSGAVKPYNNGHLMAVIGWDAHNKKVLCHDPAFPADEQVAVAYDVADFMRAWERSQRLAYIASPAHS